jgi:RHS repeat-associated protein
LICTYDAQNRLLTASKGQTTMSFAYDGLNRQVKRSVTGQPDTFSVWDGWELIEEYQPGSASATAAYVYGGSDLIAGTYNGQVYYYYHDASGSTSHLADSTGHLVEWYRYDLQGTPSFYDQNNNQRNPNQTAYGVRHLFTGQQWYQELGLYDLRNRFYSPDLGRFLQPDPIDFDGDPTHLYRYCGNNPVNKSDPPGLWTFSIGISGTGQLAFLTGGFSIGVVFDGHGNLRWYSAPLFGGGMGLEANVGVAFAGSNADSIYELRGLFGEGGFDLGAAFDAQVFSFSGRGAVSGKIVSGFGLVPGGGAGGGWYAGGTYTTLHRFWWQLPDNGWPPPGGTTDVDRTIDPDAAEVERVVVTGTVPPDVSGYGAEGVDYVIDRYNRVSAYHPLTGSYSWGVPGFGGIGNYFENFGAFGPLIAPTSPFANPVGTMGLVYGGANGGWNMGAGELINAWTEGGKKPADL